MNLDNNITVSFKDIESPVISNANVFGLANAVRGSKFPMAVNVDNLTSDITNTTKSLGSVATGTGHDQYLTGIITQFDLTFTVKAWTEAERYHFFNFISSQSTMHRIAKFDLEKQYNEYVDEEIIAIIQKLQKNYNETGSTTNYLKLLYSNPCGFKLTAAMTTNYRQLKTIYYQRKNHRLPEWQTFCEQLEQFPYFKELCLNEVDN